jgi:DnaJ-class molecular chaperone
LQVSTPGGKPRTIEVKIPAGLRPGKKVRVPGEGATANGGAQKGDLYLRIKVKPHNYFTIDGDNLVCELTVSPAQAVVGSEAVVTTIEGPVKIKIPAGTQSGRLLRLKGKGLPTREGSVAGDQLVRTKIVIPTELSDQERELYNQLAKLEKNKK